jgi:hypothetical protein
MEQNRLELYQLIKYLPYSVKIQRCEEQGSGIDEVQRVNIECDTIDTMKNFGCSVWEVKPILRPLSDLVIDRDGKTDIERLMLLSYEETELFKEGISNKVLCSLPYMYMFDFVNNLTNFKYSFGVYIDDVSFGLTFEFENSMNEMEVEDLVVINQLGLFEFLFVNHYDVYGLIGKGLAVDIHTI